MTGPAEAAVNGRGIPFIGGPLNGQAGPDTANFQPEVECPLPGRLSLDAPPDPFHADRYRYRLTRTPRGWAYLGDDLRTLIDDVNVLAGGIGLERPLGVRTVPRLFRGSSPDKALHAAWTTTTASTDVVEFGPMSGDEWRRWASLIAEPEHDVATGSDPECGYVEGRFAGRHVRFETGGPFTVR